MEAKRNWVPLVYGYSVCVVAVVTFLICTTVIVNNIFDLANPVQAGFGTALSSFEAYQAEQHPASAAASARPDTTSEATLRKRYEALRADHIARVTFQSWKAIVTSALLLIISVVLFVLHWRWMRRLGTAADGGGS
jgi:hypothetical protein